MKVEYSLIPRLIDEKPLKLIYQPRKNLVAEKYFSLLQKFILHGQKIDTELSYWNFFLELEQKKEIVKSLQENLDVLKLEPLIEMNYQVSLDDSQEILNEIHDKFEHYLKKINFGGFMPKHIEKIIPALLQVNILIHQIENFNRIQLQIKERGHDYIDCSFGYRFQNDEFVPLEEHDYDHFTLERPFGSLSAGYNTTGKNLLHVMNDNDLEVVKLRKVSPQVTFSTEGYFWFGQSIDWSDQYESFYRWWDANNISDYGYKKYDRKNSLGLILLADLEEPDFFAGKSHWEKLTILNNFSRVGSVRFL